MELCIKYKGDYFEHLINILCIIKCIFSFLCYFICFELLVCPIYSNRPRGIWKSWFRGSGIYSQGSRTEKKPWKRSKIWNTKSKFRDFLLCLSKFDHDDSEIRHIKLKRHKRLSKKSKFQIPFFDDILLQLYRIDHWESKSRTRGSGIVP